MECFESVGGNAFDITHDIVFKRLFGRGMVISDEDWEVIMSRDISPYFRFCKGKTTTPPSEIIMMVRKRDISLCSLYNTEIFTIDDFINNNSPNILEFIDVPKEFILKTKYDWNLKHIALYVPFSSIDEYISFCKLANPPLFDKIGLLGCCKSYIAAGKLKIKDISKAFEYGISSVF